MKMQTLFEWDFNGCNDSRIFDILVRNAGEFAPGRVIRHISKTDRGHPGKAYYSRFDHHKSGARVADR